MQTVTVPRLATFLDGLKRHGGPGTTILLVDADQIDAAIAFARSRVEKATGDWRVEVADHDPAELQGEARRRFEDATFERDNRPGRERMVYVTAEPFYVIPSIKGRLNWLYARGRAIPHPQIPKRLPSPEARKPGPTDTLWHQDERP